MSIELRKETDMLIQSHMIILDIVGDYPPTDPVFREYDEVVGKCLLCHHLFDSIESVAKEYQLDEKISELFERTKEAFIESDAKKSISAWNFETKIAKRCDEIVDELAKSDLTINEAVCFTLIARYFKRLAAHLTNIATSVVLPINELDYYDERRKNENINN